MMTSNLVSEDQPLSEEFISTITASLDAANVENVLWGDCLLIIFGVPSGLDDVDFVVPDDKITTAYAILLEMGFKECSTYKECRTLATPGLGASPAAHAHIDHARFIGLYRKSETLWSIPSLRAGHNECNSKPDIMCADDPALPRVRLGRGGGAFAQTSHPVHIISAHRLTEVYILLIERDYEKPLQYFWRNMLTYVIEFLLEDGILDTRDLKPHHRRSIKLFANPGNVKMREIFEELRLESIASNEV